MTHPTDDSANATGRPSGIDRRRFAAALALLTVIACYLRFRGLTHRTLWLDESCTFYAVHHLFDWPSQGPDPWLELAHGPYFFLLHLWTLLVGVVEAAPRSAWALRSFSALVGSLTVPLIGLVARRMGGRRVGVIAAVLVAFHPLHMHYSQEARVYALWAFEAVLTLHLLHRAARSLQARWWVAYGVTAWLLVLTHYYSLLFLPATLAVVWIADHRRRAVRQWLVVHGLLALTLAPLCWYIIQPHAGRGPAPWLEEIWKAYPGAMALPRSLWAMLPSGGYPSYLGALPHAWGPSAESASTLFAKVVQWGSVVVVLLLVVFSGVLRGARFGRDTARPTRTSSQLRTTRFLLTLVLGFLITGVLHASLVRPSYVVGRYDFVVWPALTIAIALMIDLAYRRLRVLAVPWVATGLLVAFGWITVEFTRHAQLTQDQPERARRVAAVVGQDDLLVSVNLYRWFLGYEWHRLGFAPEVISFPPSHDRQMCWQNPRAELANPQQIADDVDVVSSRVLEALTAGRRVWLLAHGAPKGLRWEVDRHFFARLQSQGVAVDLKDEWVGLAELVRSPASQTAHTPDAP